MPDPIVLGLEQQAQFVKFPQSGINPKGTTLPAQCELLSVKMPDLILIRETLHVIGNRHI